MKDQVDNLESKHITSSATINGLLDPIEKAKVIERVQDGSVSILYISPESLRSKTIERLLLGRHVVRFVIDEAHCFSTWGQDFRVDYLYIGDFIENIQKIKNQNNPIPVSCFTATAKKQVIEDILTYFNKKLGISMKLFTTNSARKNLEYKVIRISENQDRYIELRRIIDQEDSPTIVYASRHKTVEQISNRLNQDKYSASFFHGGMEKEEKIDAQNKFISGEVQIMVATNAFGMGVDKKDIGCIIHYEISSSLENYVQESGRAGRDENLNANCYILYNENDLDKHFNLLNDTKLNIKEIQQVWKAIKSATRTRNNVSKSALEIAREAGWDEKIHDLETRVKTSIAALEDAGYIKRGQNSPRVFANSILSNNVIEANKIIESTTYINEIDKDNAKRIISRLMSSKYTKRGLKKSSCKNN